MPDDGRPRGNPHSGARGNRRSQASLESLGNVLRNSVARRSAAENAAHRHGSLAHLVVARAGGLCHHRTMHISWVRGGARIIFGLAVFAVLATAILLRPPKW